MAKTYLGIDIGHDQLKLALVRGKRVLRTAAADMPENLIRDGRIVSLEMMADLLRETMRNNRIHCQRAAVVLNGDSVYVKDIVMPIMSADQLKLNLPFEFKDYIVDELKNYIYDYAMISTAEELKQRLTADPAEDEEKRKMELTGVAVSADMLQELRQMLRKAGLKMIKAAPVCCSYSALLKHYLQKQHPVSAEYGLIDLGATAIRMQIFENENYRVVRELDTGLRSAAAAVADEFDTDIHQAYSYLVDNHENCQEGEACRRCFDNISVGLVRALNFYRFSNPDSQLQDVWIIGGGAKIPALCLAIENALNIRIHSADELIDVKNSSEENCIMLPAIGIAMN